jgi:hypothetical protein
MLLNDLRRVSFWIAFACGWFITACVLSVLASLAGSDSLTGIPAVVTGIAIHALSALAGFSYARSMVRRPERKGFPVVPQSDEDRHRG